MDLLDPSAPALSLKHYGKKGIAQRNEETQLMRNQNSLTLEHFVATMMLSHDQGNQWSRERGEPNGPVTLNANFLKLMEDWPVPALDMVRRNLAQIHFHDFRRGDDHILHLLAAKIPALGAGSGT